MELIILDSTVNYFDTEQLKYHRFHISGNGFFQVIVNYWPVDHMNNIYHAKILHPKPLLKSNLNHYGLFEDACRIHVAMNLK